MSWYRKKVAFALHTQLSLGSTLGSGVFISDVAELIDCVHYLIRVWTVDKNLKFIEPIQY